MIRVVCALVLAASGCAWFDDDPPSRACRTTRDCFAAQGETCNPTTMQCEVVDAAAAAPGEAP